MSANEMPELLPCPFCGSHARIASETDIDGGRFYFVKCVKCRSKGAEFYAHETCQIFYEGVRDAWNRRSDICASGPVRALVDQAASIFTHCSVTDGVCCCGDNMEGHPHPMPAGHSPVDHGSYVADQWMEAYSALTPAPQPLTAGQMRAAVMDGSLTEAQAAEWDAQITPATQTAQEAVPACKHLRTIHSRPGYDPLRPEVITCGDCGAVLSPDAHQPQASETVAEAGYNDVIHALIKQHETVMRSKGRNPIDYTTKWSLAADAVAALRALKGGDHG